MADKTNQLPNRHRDWLQSIILRHQPFAVMCELALRPCRGRCSMAVLITLDGGVVGHRLLYCPGNARRYCGYKREFLSLLTKLHS
jgi:hypothetical protein